MSMAWRDHISVNPQVCHGKPCVKGTRIMASIILDNLAAGRTVQQIQRSYPELSEADIQATMEYAAELARERVVSYPTDAA
jgi:uncharacterized protein (DUF433 family)